MSLITTIPLIIHASTGAIALLTGLLELFFRKRILQIIFITTSALSLLAGMILIPRITAGISVQLAFSTLLVTWTYILITLIIHFKNKKIKETRTWIMRTIALLSFFVTMRMWRALLIYLGLNYETAYANAAWLGWIVNILLVEYTLLRKH